MVLQLVDGEAVLPPFAIPQPPPEASLRAEVTRLRDRVDQQARLIERQAEHIDVLEQLLSPPEPGRLGLARLRRSPWWLRTAHRLGFAA